MQNNTINFAPAQSCCRLGRTDQSPDSLLQMSFRGRGNAEGNRQRREVASGRRELASQRSMNVLVQVLDKALMITNEISFSLPPAMVPTRPMAPISSAFQDATAENDALEDDCGTTVTTTDHESAPSNHGWENDAGSSDDTIDRKS